LEKLEIYLCFAIYSGIIAGGERALRQSIEGAEDVIADGISAVLDKDVNEHDIVIGD